MTTWNPSDKGAGWTLSGSDLVATRNATATNDYHVVRSTTSKTTGKHYAEVTCTDLTGGAPDLGIGVVNASASLTNYIGNDSTGAQHRWNGFRAINGSVNGGSTTYAEGDVISVYLNLDDDEVSWYKNGTLMNSAVSISFITGAKYLALDSSSQPGIATVNFGGSTFAYTPPAGATAWDTASGATGTLDATEGADSASFVGQFTSTGTLAATEGADVAAFSGGPTVPVVIFYGQSNQVSNGVTGSPANATTSRTKIWNATAAAFQTYNPGVNSGQSASDGLWGPEAQFAYDWEQDTATGTLYIVKHAVAGTGMVDWTDGGSLYSALTTKVTNALAALANPTVQCAFQFQGETDAEDMTQAGLYQGRLEDLIAAGRTDWGVTKFVLGRIYEPDSFYVGEDTVRAAIEAVAAADDEVSYINADDLTFTDGIHFNAAGIQTLGDRFYANFLAVEITSTGTLAATEGADGSAFAGKTTSTGTLAATEGADGGAFAGKAISTGTLAATEGADGSAFAGKTVSTGTLSGTEGADVAAFAGKAISTGTLSGTEGADGSAFAGKTTSTGTLAATEGADSALFLGAGVTPTSTGTLSGTEGADSAAFAGKSIVTGALAATEGADGGAFAGKTVSTGTLAATEGADLFAGVGTVASGASTGTLSGTEGADSAALAGKTTSTGTLSGTEGADLAAFAQTTPVTPAYRIATVSLASRIATVVLNTRLAA
jgi:hypothetical protein